MMQGGGNMASSSRPRAAPPPRRDRYVGKACQQCRRRKTKCDGVSPQCSRCRLLHDECTYADERDTRRAVSQGYVRGLESRIKVLEGLLDRHVPGWSSTEDTNHSAEPSSWGQTRLSSDDDDGPEALMLGMDNLKLDAETHELQQYGPTSALQHLPSHESSFPDQSNTVVLSPQYNPWTRRLSSSLANDELSIVDWRRHLPPLPEWDVQLHDSLIDLFFRCFSFYHIVDEASFRQDMFECLGLPFFGSSSPGRTRTSNYSPVLHNAMLAAVCEYSDDTRASKDEIGAILLRASQHELFVEGDRPTLSTVQGVLLIGHYFTCTGKHGLGYFYTGIAIRMSHTLGLGVDCTSYVQRGILSESDRHAREKTFWVSHLYDKLWSSYIGHEPSLKYGRSQIKLPQAEQDPDPQWSAPSSDQAIVSSLSTTIQTTFRHTCQLATLQERVMAIVYGQNAGNLYSAATINKVSIVGLRLDQWFEALPDDSRLMPQCISPTAPHVIVMNIYYHFLVLLLYRPFYLRQNSPDNETINDIAQKRCKSSSTRVTSLLGLFDKSSGLRFAPVCLVQFGCMACTTHLLEQLHAPTKTSSEAGDASRKCLTLLKKIGRPCRAALQHAEMLDKMINDYKPDIQSEDRSQAQSVNFQGGIVSRGPQPDITSLLTAAGRAQPHMFNLPSTDTQPYYRPDVFDSAPSGLASPQLFVDQWSWESAPNLDSEVADWMAAVMGSGNEEQDVR